MITIEVLTAFFGWCSVFNIGLLALTTVFLLVSKDWVSGIHASLFGLDRAELLPIYFGYLAHYKIAILVFNLVPYIALRVMV